MKVIDKLSTYASLVGVVCAIGGGFYAWGEFNTRLDVLEKKKFSRHFLNIKNPNRKYLAIPYGSHYIWGATARILYNLSEKFFYR